MIPIMFIMITGFYVMSFHRNWTEGLMRRLWGAMPIAISMTTVTAALRKNFRAVNLSFWFMIVPTV